MKCRMTKAGVEFKAAQLEYRNTPRVGSKESCSRYLGRRQHTTNAAVAAVRTRGLQTI